MNVQKYRTELKRLVYLIRYRYMTLNNVVMAVALAIAAVWVWGSIAAVQRNFALQHNLEDKNRQLALTQLEVETLKYQGEYYKSTEYQELTAREHLGLALPGEKLLVLPPNSEKVLAESAQKNVTQLPSVEKQSNFSQWIDFFSGKNSQSLR